MAHRPTQTAALVLVVATFVAVAAQAPARRATNIAAIRAYPGYFHLQPVVVAGTLGVLNGDVSLDAGAASLPVLVNAARVPDGTVEVRGEVWDIGRMRPEDPRLVRARALDRLHMDPDASWPRPGDLVVLVADALVPATPTAVPSIRGIVLDPAHYLEQTVTVTGQFSGRNLTGDLPDAPGRSRWDFVLRSADAAVWVSGAEPKGRTFSLELDQRRDTERWLRVTGTLREGGGLQWIEATSDQLALASEPEAPSAAVDTSTRVPVAPAPEVIFSAPTAGEIDVAVNTTVRIQFSRDIDPQTFAGHIVVSYRTPGGAGAAGAPSAPVFTTAYHAANRVLEITFAEPLARFRTAVVTLDREILGTDGQPLTPWSLTFELGG